MTAPPPRPGFVHLMLYLSDVDEHSSLLGIRAPSDCFWVPRYILYTKSLHEIVAGLRISIGSILAGPNRERRNSPCWSISPESASEPVLLHDGRTAPIQPRRLIHSGF